ncbi:NAAT family transporter [Hymenobacter lapidiphilus]|uniref:MarC family protein n=1 Tax=Hymenobacter sp. CCM 8763 TaxID=2303334 RepID=UPI000E3517F4|nr:MarC family protein [Hymenobacter sp. CCM 8763]RFP66026.1 NAAT family transporter [Hymenobacter sp. CCM 8763]
MDILLATFTTLFSVVNPFGAMPVFLSLTESDTPAERANIGLKACLSVLAVLSVSFFAGQYVLNFFGINIHHLRIAGGILLMRSAFDLLTPGGNRSKVSEETIEASREKDDISFTPLAMPMLSGPGAIAVCISLYTNKLTYFDMGLIFVGFVLVALAVYIILMSSLRLTRFLGRPGLAALARIMGFITLAIGVNFIMTAIKALFVS